MALSNRQTFFFDGQTYNYRITEAGIRRFEQDGKRRIHSGMSLTMVVRALYYVSQNSTHTQKPWRILLAWHSLFDGQSSQRTHWHICFRVVTQKNED